MNDTPLIVIKCLTYNQDRYIRKTLEGFVMQKTNFPFVAIVHDDASSDNTAFIIQEYAEKYPSIIKPIFEIENQYSKGVNTINNLINEALIKSKTKYIAFCEGDDYWTDPLKLQKQVEFLEANPDYGMCYTKIRNFNQSKKKFGNEWGGANESFHDLLGNGNTIPTLTVVCRSDLYLKYHEEIKPQDKKWPMGDYPMWLYFAHESKIKFLDEVTGVYRELPESASHTKDNKKWLRFCKGFRDIKLYFAHRYNCMDEYESVIRYIHFRLLLRRYAFNYDLKDACLGALEDIKFQNNTKKHLLKIAINNKFAYILMRCVYGIHYTLRY